MVVLQIKSFKKWFRLCVPLGGMNVLRWIRLRKTYRKFDGEWRAALPTTTTYAADDVLERVLAATMKVQTGESAFERDGVNFEQIQYSWPLAIGLLLASSSSDGVLRVVDFGGGLGSAYFQNRAFLRLIDKVEWWVVEQTNFVRAGNENVVGDGDILFADCVENLPTSLNPNAILLSSVLQYLESPITILESLCELSAEYLIIDRTPFCEGQEDQLYVQVVPKIIYKASYPMWALSKTKLFDLLFQAGYELVEEFDSPEGAYRVGVNKFNFLGAIFRKINEYKVKQIS